MKTFLKMLLAAIVAAGMACVAIANGASDNLVIVTLFAASIAVSVLLGVYGMKGRHTSIKDGARSLEQAA